MRKLLVLFLAFVLGCEAYVPMPDGPAIQPIKRDYILAVVLDTLGSFDSIMFGGSASNDPLAAPVSGEARGFKFFLKACDAFFTQRLGSDDRVVIAQLSSNNRSLLYEGSPLAMRKKFRSPDVMRAYLAQHATANGSPVYASLADTLTYLKSLPGVQSGETRLCILVLSDMEDNSPTQAADRQRAVESLRSLNKSKAGIGFYWVSQTAMDSTRQMMTDAGIDASLIECEIVDQPKLPVFAQ